MPFTVTLTGCVAGNPLKAWRGSTGEADTEHVPDDVWQDLAPTFDTIDEAKGYILDLHFQTSTHVVLLDIDGSVLYNQDAGDPLDVAASGVVPPSLIPPPLSDDDVPPAPPLVGG